MSGPASAPRQLSPPQSLLPPPIALPDKKERFWYYYGLASQPPLLARTGTNVWTVPCSPFNHPKPKQLKNVGDHKVVGMWDNGLAAGVLEVLETYSVQWTSVELFRIGEVGQKDMPVILWIGVRPGTLTGEDGTSLPITGNAAVACKKVLVDNNVLDVECEIKESETYRCASLVKPSKFRSPVVDLEVFFTPTLGTCISRQGQNEGGTHGFYVKFPDHPGKVYGVTCRHVVFPYTKHDNETYDHRDPGQPRHSILLPGDAFLQELRERARKGAEDHNLSAANQQECLANLAEGGGGDEDWAKQGAEGGISIKYSQWTAGIFHRLVRDIDTKWKAPDSRVMGHLVYSPPIGTFDDPESNYIRDWCLYEVDPMKINDFSGNVIDLGSEVMPAGVTNAMNSNIENGSYQFSYPPDRQWEIQNICIPRDERRYPKKYGWEPPRISVLKRGKTTGVTCGIANEVDSITCIYSPEPGTVPFISSQWAIVGCDAFSCFSADGDSGSLVVDARGRMGGMITCVSGRGNWSDVSYATPMEFILADMERFGWKEPNTDVTH